jgi:sugar lactone lactonase YvrE
MESKSDREYMMVQKDGYKVEYLASQMFGLPESPIWSDDHQAFYWED